MNVIKTYAIPAERLRLEMMRLEGGAIGFRLFRHEGGRWVQRAGFDAGAHGDLAAAEAAAARLVPGFAAVLLRERLQTGGG